MFLPPAALQFINRSWRQGASVYRPSGAQVAFKMGSRSSVWACLGPSGPLQAANLVGGLRVATPMALIITSRVAWPKGSTQLGRRGVYKAETLLPPNPPHTTYYQVVRPPGFRCGEILPRYQVRLEPASASIIRLRGVCAWVCVVMGFVSRASGAPTEQSPPNQNHASNPSPVGIDLALFFPFPWQFAIHTTSGARQIHTGTVPTQAGDSF